MKLDASALTKRSLFSVFMTNKKVMLALSELLVAGMEIVLFIASFYVPLFIVLTGDLFLLSPLIIGRALLYDTYVCDENAVSFRLLFRYYRFSYYKTVYWRLLLWVCAMFKTLLLSAPVCCLLLFRQYTIDTFSWNAITFLYLCFLIGTLFFQCYLSAYYSSTAWLLIYTRKTSLVFHQYKSLFGNTFTAFGNVYMPIVKYLPWFFLSPFSAIIKFRIHQASVMREKIDVFLQKEMSANLERLENI